MDDKIAKATRNYHVQKTRYDTLVAAKRKAEEDIERATKALEVLDRKLPIQEAWYLEAKRIYDAYGDRKNRDNLRKRYQLMCEIARLSGKPQPPEPNWGPEPVDPTEDPSHQPHLIQNKPVTCRTCGHYGLFLDFSDTLDPKDTCRCPKCNSTNTSWVPEGEEVEG